jgi:hypothetical protein
MRDTDGNLSLSLLPTVNTHARARTKRRTKTTKRQNETEGKFTIKYPKGYDPDLKKFVTVGAGKNVVVEKLPSAKQAVRGGENRGGIYI